MKQLKPMILCLLLAGSPALAQTTATAATAAAQPATATVPADKLATDFSTWAGSQENAASLVNGLRTGTAVTLTAAGPGGTTVTTTTFSPTTRPMGYGNVRIALSLARTQLARQGIANPTPEQLQGALVGSPTGPTQGILQMRASGMGWGQIANSMGVRLGAVMSGKQAIAAPAPTTAAGTSAPVSSGGARKGVVTAAGGSAGGQASGVTTAAGGSGKVATGLGHAYGQGGSGSGVVNAGGVKAGGGAAGSNAGGSGKGGGKP